MAIYAAPCTRCAHPVATSTPRPQHYRDMGFDRRRSKLLMVAWQPGIHTPAPVRVVALDPAIAQPRRLNVNGVLVSKWRDREMAMPRLPTRVGPQVQARGGAARRAGSEQAMNRAQLINDAASGSRRVRSSLHAREWSTTL